MEDSVSIISNLEENFTGEASNSNSSMTCPCPASKRARCGNSEISTKFKGVAPQDGKWGAKIYANYQLIWLGTFNSEKEAAMAYDSAALKLHHKGNTRNFPCTNVTAEEKFQDGYTMQTLLDMIRVGCYQKKFAEYLKTCSRSRELSVMQSGRKYKQIFSKKLTPSDLNKQYALSIPKLYAIKYFPHISGSAEDVEHGEVKDTYLTFNDMMTRSWKFRYCYWKSSRSFLFKKGWSSFVKENQLKTRDTIIFYMSDSDTEGGAEEVKFLIDYSRHEESDSSVDADYEHARMQSELKLELSRNEDENKFEELEMKETKTTNNIQRKGFRLFGVQIN